MTACHDMPEREERHGDMSEEEQEHQEQTAFEDDAAELDGAVALDAAGLDGWDECWLTPVGYVLARGKGDDECGYGGCVALRTLRDGVNSFLFFRQDGLPSQIYVGKDRLYFNFLSDGLLEIVRGNAEYYDYGATVRLAAGELAVEASDFMDVVGLAGRLLSRAVDLPDVFRELAAAFSAVGSYEPVGAGDIDVGRATAGLTALSAYFDAAYSSAVNGLLVWSGWTALEVSDTSARLGGTVQCGNTAFATAGEYGIVCATDMADLTVERAPFRAEGCQDGVSTCFTVGLEGLSPATTYYYCSYYRFFSAAHTPLIFAYGQPSDGIQYESVPKTFTTR